MNKDIIKKVLEQHEKDHPDQKALNDIAIEDLTSLGKASISKPIAMEASYLLDGHPQQRKTYSDNFDYLLLPREKETIDDEVLDLSELSAMLHDPEYILNKAEHNSENQELSREALLHLLERYGDTNGYQAVMNNIFQPLLSNILDKVSEEETAVKQLLSPAIVKRTPHHPKEHSKNMEMIFTMPIIDGNAKENWKASIPHMLQGVREGKYGQ